MKKLYVTVVLVFCSIRVKAADNLQIRFSKSFLSNIVEAGIRKKMGEEKMYFTEPQIVKLVQAYCGVLRN